jgi:ABC-type uncharacterized transport system permease subunit
MKILTDLGARMGQLSPNHVVMVVLVMVVVAVVVVVVVTMKLVFRIRNVIINIRDLNAETTNVTLKTSGLIFTKLGVASSSKETLMYGGRG